MSNQDANLATRSDIAELHDRIDNLVDTMSEIKTCVAVTHTNQQWVIKLGGIAATITSIAAAFGGWWAKTGLGSG